MPCLRQQLHSRSSISGSFTRCLATSCLLTPSPGGFLSPSASVYLVKIMFFYKKKFKLVCVWTSIQLLYHKPMQKKLVSVVRTVRTFRFSFQLKSQSPLYRRIVFEYFRSFFRPIHYLCCLKIYKVSVFECF